MSKSPKSPPTIRHGIGRVVTHVSSSPAPVAKSSGSTAAKPSIVHEVKNVFISIPPELSATGFELKIAGLVRLMREVHIH